MFDFNKLFVAVLLAGIWGAAGAQAQPKEMTFFAVLPHQPTQLFGNAWSIHADGPIDPDAPIRFKRLITEKNIPANSLVYSNSPGGSLYAGMELGHLIRKHHLFTNVLKRGELETTRQFQSYKSLPGGCFSACTLAYIGGVFRWIDAKSVYGVHRFFANGSLDADAAQVTSSAIVQYIRQMRVDSDLFDEMTKAGREEINILPRGRLEALGVVNNGTERARWTLGHLE